MGLQLRRGRQRGPCRAARPARRQGREPCRNGRNRPARAARLHDHDRGLHGLPRRWPALPRRPRRANPRRDGECRARRRADIRRSGAAAAVLRPVRGARVDAGDDGHRAEPRPERRDRCRAGGDVGRPAVRVGQLSPVHPDVRLGRARRVAPLFRGDHRDGESRRRHGRGRRTRSGSLAAGGRDLQGAGAARDGRAVSAGSGRAVVGCDRCRVRLMDEPARERLPQVARHPGRVGHGGDGAGDGVRQHGRGLRDRRVFHARSVHRRERVLRRIPGQRAGRGRRRGHPHAAADFGADGGGGAAFDGAGAAGRLCGVAEGARHAGDAFPRHAGHRVHRSAQHALHAADAHRKARRRRRVADRGRDGARRPDHRSPKRSAASIRRRSISCCTGHSIRRRNAICWHAACPRRPAPRRARSRSPPRMSKAGPRGARR